MAYWLDDGFDTWPETVRAGTAAAGLYARCGSWIARNTHDGYVPNEVAAMYGSPEWARRLVDVGLWTVEAAGYQDVRYFQMGNPTAEKVAERRKADADRKARWRAKRDASRRDSTRDSGGTHGVGDGGNPFSPALPPPKGGKGAAASAGAMAPAAAPGSNPTPTDDRLVDWDDPLARAEREEELRLASEQAVRDREEADRIRREGKARAMAAAGLGKPPKHAAPEAPPATNGAAP